MMPAEQQRKDQHQRQSAENTERRIIQRIRQQITDKDRQRHAHRIDDERPDNGRSIMGGNIIHY
jgi:hypothetical protein